MIRTKVKLHLKDNDGNKDVMVTWINLSEQEAHTHYIGKWLAVSTEPVKLMKCHKVETLNIQEAKKKDRVFSAI